MANHRLREAKSLKVIQLGLEFKSCLSDSKARLFLAYYTTHPPTTNSIIIPSQCWALWQTLEVQMQSTPLPTTQFSSVQSLSRVWLFVTPWTAARQASLSITNSQSLLKLMSINSVMPFNHLILCRPLLLLPSVFHSLSLSVSVYYKWVYSLHSKEGDFKRAWISECREYWEIITEATNDTAWPWLKQQTFFSSKFLR